MHRSLGKACQVQIILHVGDERFQRDLVAVGEDSIRFNKRFQIQLFDQRR